MFYIDAGTRGQVHGEMGRWGDAETRGHGDKSMGRW